MRITDPLRCFSVLLPAGKLSAPVVPSPEQSEFGQWLNRELESLRRRPRDELIGSHWLLNGLDLALAAQRKAYGQLVGLNDDTEGSGKFRCGLAMDSSSIPSESIEIYLRDSIDMLDACNGLRERLDMVNKYTQPLNIALHWLEGAATLSSITLSTVSTKLEQCLMMERKSGGEELGPSRSMLRRLGDKLIKDGSQKDSKRSSTGTRESKIQEALCGSMSITTLTCSLLSIALSFKSKRGLAHVPDARTKPNWCNTLQELHNEIKLEVEARTRKSGFAAMNELSAASDACRSLRNSILRQRDQSSSSNATRVDQEELRPLIKILERRCEELESGVGFCRQRVDELYKLLISVRMSALELLQQAN